MRVPLPTEKYKKKRVSLPAFVRYKLRAEWVDATTKPNPARDKRVSRDVGEGSSSDVGAPVLIQMGSVEYEETTKNGGSNPLQC